MACAWLSEAGVSDPPAALRVLVDERRWFQVAELARRGLHSPLTTSMGRLFDAVSAICGVRAEVNYEGQAAIELEAACDPAERRSYPISVATEVDRVVIDPRETIRAITADLRGGAAIGAIASRFHAAVASATVEACAHAASRHGTELVVLSGGVFANRRLGRATLAGLAAAGLRALVPERLPVGDGGISYGQAAIAARRMS